MRTVLLLALFAAAVSLAGCARGSGLDVNRCSVFDPCANPACCCEPPDPCDPCAGRDDVLPTTPQTPQQ